MKGNWIEDNMASVNNEVNGRLFAKIFLSSFKKEELKVPNNIVFLGLGVGYATADYMFFIEKS